MNKKKCVFTEMQSRKNNSAFFCFYRLIENSILQPKAFMIR